MKKIIFSLIVLSLAITGIVLSKESKEDGRAASKMLELKSSMPGKDIKEDDGALIKVSEPVSATIMKGDKAAGKAKSQNCSACHGATGISSVPMYPNLAGQGARYLVKQTLEIKEGVRSVPEMMPFVSNISRQDIEDIAAFYESQPAALSATDPKYVPLGEWIYKGGIDSKKIPACSACHSYTGSGNSLAGFPNIAGQHAQYTAKQLHDFRKGVRMNDTDTAVMRTIAEKLSDKEIEAVSNYIQGLRK